MLEDLEVALGSWEVRSVSVAELVVVVAVATVSVGVVAPENEPVCTFRSERHDCPSAKSSVRVCRSRRRDSHEEKPASLVGTEPCEKLSLSDLVPWRQTLARTQRSRDGDFSF